MTVSTARVAGSDGGGPVGPTPEAAPTRHTAAIVAAVIAVVVVLLVWLLATRPVQADRPVGTPLLGKIAPPIDALDTVGKTFDLDNYRGSWVLVNFFATWCAPCKAEHPELEKFSTEHAGVNDAFLVSVAFNDEPAAVRQYFLANGGSWPVIAQGNARIALDYGVVKLPESYLVSPTGLVAAKYESGVRASDVDRLIAEYSAPATGSGG